MPSFKVVNKYFFLSNRMADELDDKQNLVIRYHLSDGVSTQILYGGMGNLAPGVMPTQAELEGDEVNILEIANA